MTVESIYEKKITSSKKSKLKGRLFDAIIPNHKTKKVKCYFSQENVEEARGVARGLLLFIRDFYKLDPNFFCSSNSVSEAL